MALIGDETAGVLQTKVIIYFFNTVCVWLHGNEPQLIVILVLTLILLLCPNKIEIVGLTDDVKLLLLMVHVMEEPDFGNRLAKITDLVAV